MEENTATQGHRFLSREKAIAIGRWWVVLAIAVVAVLFYQLTLCIGCSILLHGRVARSLFALFSALVFFTPAILTFFVMRPTLGAAAGVEGSKFHRSARTSLNALLIAWTTSLGVICVSIFFDLYCSTKSGVCASDQLDMSASAAVTFFAFSLTLLEILLIYWAARILRNPILPNESLSVSERPFFALEFFPFWNLRPRVVRRIGILILLALTSLSMFAWVPSAVAGIGGYFERFLIYSNCPEPAKLVLEDLRVSVNELVSCSSKEVFVDDELFFEVKNVFGDRSSIALPSVSEKLVDAKGNIFPIPNVPEGAESMQPYMAREFGRGCSGLGIREHLVYGLSEGGTPILRFATSTISVPDASPEYVRPEPSDACRVSANIVEGDDGIFRLHDISVSYRALCESLSSPLGKAYCWDTKARVERDVQLCTKIRVSGSTRFDPVADRSLELEKDCLSDVTDMLNSPQI